VRSRLLTALVATFLAAAAALAALVIIRADYQRSGAHRDENLVAHPVLGHAPVARRGQTWEESDQLETVGQRLESIDSKRGQVLIMGDSVLYGWGVDEAETAAALLRKRLEAAFGVQVLNASVSGYSIDQYLLYLERQLPRMKPLVVVVGLYAGNDYESAGRENWHGHAKPVFLLRNGALKLAREGDPGNRCIDYLGGSLLYKLLWNSPALAEGLVDSVCGAVSLEEPEQAAVVAGLIERIRTVVESHGALLLYVLLPDRNDFREGSDYVLHQSKYGALATVLKSGGYEVVWFYDDIVASGLAVDDLFISEDAAHFTALGNRLLAASLAEAVGNCLR